MVSVVGAAYLLTGAGLLLLLRQPATHLEKPGSKGFIIAVVGTALWPVSSGLNTLVTDLGLSIAIWNFRLLAAGIVSVGWFLVAYEFTTRRFPPRALLGGLGGYLLASQALAWTNPAHGLVLGAQTGVQAGVLVPDLGPWFWVQTLINYALIFGATGLLATDALRSHGLRQRQAALLAMAVVPPIAANVVTLLGLVDTIHDLTPFGLIGSGLVLSFTLYRLEFLNIVPIGRDVAVDVMEDAVVIADETGQVVDCNGATRRLFDVGTDYYGQSLAAVLGVLPDSTLHELESTDPTSAGESTRREFSVSLHGDRRHFLVTQSPVTATGNDRLGRVLVFRDVTPLKRREEDLELLRQILSRVLRHNLRTHVNVIEAYTDLLMEDHEDERLEKIRSANRALEELGVKSGHLERVIKSEDIAERYDLLAVVEDAVATVSDQFPEAAIQIAGAEETWIRSSPGLPLVVENIVENAVEHNEATQPTVSIEISTAGCVTTLQVEDDGTGIPEAELAVIEAGRETQLRHASGIGLWLVKWWADRAEVPLDFETGPDGTVVTLEFDRYADAPTDAG